MAHAGIDQEAKTENEDIVFQFPRVQINHDPSDRIVRSHYITCGIVVVISGFPGLGVFVGKGGHIHSC
eukprot:3106771-Pyramimonas_sp.AAC.1